MRFGIFTFPDITSVQELTLSIQVITLVGVILTIALSKLSLNRQNRAAARESIEQLDDLEIRPLNVKLKPILHKYSAWPTSNAEVKLKIYRRTDVAGLSREFPYFVAFPGYTFKDYKISTVKDGYLLTINSASAVDIRRITERLLADIGNISRKDDNTQWMEYDKFKNDYENSKDGTKEEVHRDLLKFLNNSNPRTKEHIRDEVSKRYNHDNKIINLAFADLLMTGEIVESNGSDKYTTV